MRMAMPARKRTKKMCISPIKIPINAKKIYVNHNPKLINVVPCGKCYECKRVKTQDLMIRSYYDNSDYYIFDTLTYDEGAVPWLKEDLESKTGLKLDIPNIRVLRYSDYQKFMKRLRKKIEKYYPDTKLKYIVGAEYGNGCIYMDERGRFRQGTNRPHWHIILGVTGSIPPEILSEYISEKWECGRTDGIKYKGADYFWNKRYFKDYTGKYNVVGYVSKYLTKTNKYDEYVKDIVTTAEKQIYDKTFHCNTFQMAKDDIRKVINEYKQFNKWSKGFGEEFLNNENNITDYENKGFIQIKTDLHQRKYNLPLYYRRKIYFEKVGDETRLNQRGIRFKDIELNRQLQHNKEKLLVADIAPQEKINDIAQYWTYYKDRLITKDEIKITYDGVILENENSAKDRMNYPDGRIKINNKYQKTKQFIDRHITRFEEYDLIIEKSLKKIYDMRKPFCELKEKVEDTKKRKN